MTRVLSLLVTVTAFLFLGFLAFRGFDGIPPIDLTSPQTIISIFVALALYTSSQIIAALAWTATLRAWRIKLPPGRSECHILLSQIGKYLPGNFAHFIGRFALARSDGVPVTVICAAVLTETGLLIVSGVLVVGGVVMFAPDLLYLMLGKMPATSSGNAVWGAPALGLVAIAFISVFFQRQIRHSGIAPFAKLWLTLPVLAHLVNFGVLGASLLFVSEAIVPAANLGYVYTTAIFVIAWIAGFIIPGAPGGLGVREGVIAIGLGLVIGDGAAITVALLHRGISILGDGLTFGIGWVIQARVSSTK